MNFKEFFGHIFYFLHNYSPFLMFIYSIFTTNYIALMFILIIMILVIFSWYIFNCCMAIPIENWFFGKKKNITKKNLEKFFTFEFFGEKILVFDYAYKSTVTYSNLFFIMFLIVKMYYLYKIQKDKADKLEKECKAKEYFKSVNENEKKDTITNIEKTSDTKDDLKKDIVDEISQTKSKKKEYIQQLQKDAYSNLIDK